MTIDKNIADKLALRILQDVGIIECLDFIVSDAKDQLEGSYGEPDGSGSSESQSVPICIDGEFISPFKRILTERQKDKLLEELIENDKLIIDVESNDRQNLNLSFFVKMKRASRKKSSLLYIEIKFPDYQRFEYSVNGQFFDDIEDDEVSKILMLYELNI
jgi:hypothetical protein